ncbi:MAG: hypothetical protein AB1698_01540 [Pseudomonadota bacterium]
MDRKSPYRPSAPGIARYPWVNKPDTKFAAPGSAGVFKTDLILEGEAAVKERTRVDAEAQAAFDAETEGMTPGEKKKWELYVPYTVEEDDEGNPTGRIIFHFKQSASITVEGVAKPIRIAIFNAADEPKEIPVFGGDTIRVMHKPRAIKLPSAKKAGVRLDFLKVQVLKKAERDSQPGGFGSVEGGYMGEEGESGFGASSGSATADADY